MSTRANYVFLKYNSDDLEWSNLCHKKCLVSSIALKVALLNSKHEKLHFFIVSISIPSFASCNIFLAKWCELPFVLQLRLPSSWSFMITVDKKTTISITEFNLTRTANWKSKEQRKKKCNKKFSWGRISCAHVWRRRIQTTSSHWRQAWVYHSSFDCVAFNVSCSMDGEIQSDCWTHVCL